MLDASKKPSTTTWAVCKAAMKDWPRPGIVALLHELYELSDENRQYLHARLLQEESKKTREDIKRKLNQMLSLRVVWGNRFRHIDLKRVIDAFEKASDDPAGVAE